MAAATAVLLLTGMAAAPAASAGGLAARPADLPAGDNVLSGRVTDVAGEPLDADVSVSTAGQRRDARTDADGRWTVTDLPDGEYRVRATTYEYIGVLGDLAPRYYGNTDGGPGGSVPIALSGGERVDDVDITLLRLSSVSGTASQDSALWDYGYLIHAVDVATGESYSDFYGTDGPASDGTFTVPHLPAGDYRLEFRGPYGAYYYGDTSVPEDARIVAIEPGRFQDLTGFDVRLGAPPVIEGRLRDLDGQRLRWSYCDTGKVETDDIFRASYVENGRFSVAVPMGRSLRLMAERDEVHTPITDCLTLQAGERHTVPLVPVPGPRLSGTITLPQDNWRRRYSVTVQGATGSVAQTVASGRIDANVPSFSWTGVAEGLPAGDYTVFVYVQAVGYGFAASEDPRIRPAPVHLDADSEWIADIAFTAGARIQGRIHGKAGNIVDGRVYAYEDASSTALAASASVWGGGQFDLWGLEPGTYTLRFEGIDSQGTVQTPQWYAGTTDQAGATRIPLPSASSENEFFDYWMLADPAGPVSPPPTPGGPAEPGRPAEPAPAHAVPPLGPGSAPQQASVAEASRADTRRLAYTGGDEGPAPALLLAGLLLGAGISLRWRSRRTPSRCGR